MQMRDDHGVQLRILVEGRGLAEVQQEIITDPDWETLLQNGILTGSLTTFLEKNIGGSDDMIQSGSLWRILILILASTWKSRQNSSGSTAQPVLFIERRHWMEPIVRYAQKKGVRIKPVPSAFPAINPRAVLSRLIRPEFIHILRVIRYRGIRSALFSTRQASTSKWGNPKDLHGPFTGQEYQYQIRHQPGPVVATDFFGQLNLDRPELHSDLFFWQQSSLEGSDLLLNLRFATAPLTDEGWGELRKHDISAVALHPGATVVSSIPVHKNTRRVKPGKQLTSQVTLNRTETKWLRSQVSDYQTWRSYWTDLFKTYNVKIYTAWHKHGPEHCAITDGLRSIGGITAIYQRSYEPLPFPMNAVASDIVFGFSTSTAEAHRLSKSVIPYHITTGYVGDHRFQGLQSHAKDMRKRLEQNGAKRIVAYFDQNTIDDSRWFMGHEFTQQNIAFLLEKLLPEPWLGLLIKPHAPRHFRHRLGPAEQILTQAEATGRCYVYGGDGVVGSHPPAAAALASDVAIHGHVNPGTAGIESALAGVPTLFLDREGWSDSPLYQLGNKVIFSDWEGLWDACLQQWFTPDGVSGFGDWAPILDELDPFRDGRAAERIGEYIKWMLDGFRAGLDRDTILADAAERYCKQWGYDKVIGGNCSLLPETPATPVPELDIV